MEHIIEMRGIPRKEIVQYFRDICDEIEHNRKFKKDGWMVEIGEEGCCSLGSVKLSTIRIVFTGEEHLLESVIYAFNMKFLRGGG